MIEVRIENKEAKHGLNVNGKSVEFINGSAMVTEQQAEIIKEWKDPQYKIVEPKPEKPTKKSRSKPQPKKKE